MKVLSGIVTFNPQLLRLENNINTIIKQDTDILIFDNGSKNQDKVSMMAKRKDCKIICSKKNEGIAYGLKEIMEYAKKNRYDWVLTLDQDSVADQYLIDEYKKYVNNSSIGALTCIIRDRNFVDISNVPNKEVKYLPKCITAGCFMRVSAYDKTSGYDIGMFIDAVDFDICYALRKVGFVIAQIPYVGLLHEVGKGFNVSFFGKKYIMYNEAPWRRFYMMRNEIYVARKFPDIQSPIITVFRCFWNIFLVFLYEGEKFSKLRNGILGVVKGLLMKRPSNI